MTTAPGTDFPDSVKLQARKLAAFRCSYCRFRMGDHVHHITPKEEGGQGDLDNAMFLCVSCHDLYGHRPDRRAQLRQARDDWYEIVRDMFSTADIEKLANELTNVFANVATKEDIRQLEGVIKNFAARAVGNIQSGEMAFEDAANLASSLASSVVAPPSHRFRHDYHHGYQYDYTHPAYRPNMSVAPLTIGTLIEEDEKKKNF